MMKIYLAGIKTNNTMKKGKIKEIKAIYYIKLICRAEHLKKEFIPTGKLFLI